MSESNLNRRDLIKVLGFGVAAELVSAHELGTADSRFRVPSNYAPRFLNKPEYQLTSELCDIIIPSDDQSPGAMQAGVPWFIDTVLLYADRERQLQWRAGLSDIDALAVRMKGRSFLECSDANRVEVVEHLAQSEQDSETHEARFFGELKALAIEAFCLSELGMTQYLHYRGNTALAEFPGCGSHSTASILNP